jgi:hypothetical protein
MRGNHAVEVDHLGLTDDVVGYGPIKCTETAALDDLNELDMFLVDVVETLSTRLLVRVERPTMIVSRRASVSQT